MEITERQRARVVTVYLLHIYPPFKHAKHYIGFTTQEVTEEKILRRVTEHKRGRKSSSPMLRAALAAGCTLKLAKVWPTADRNFERKLKNRKNSAAFCPCCNSKHYVEIIYNPQEKTNDKNETASPPAIRSGEVLSRLPADAGDMPSHEREVHERGDDHLLDKGGQSEDGIRGCQETSEGIA